MELNEKLQKVLMYIINHSKKTEINKNCIYNHFTKRFDKLLYDIKCDINNDGLMNLEELILKMERADTLEELAQKNKLGNQKNKRFNIRINNSSASNLINVHIHVSLEDACCINAESLEDIIEDLLENIHIK